MWATPEVPITARLLLVRSACLAAALGLVVAAAPATSRSDTAVAIERTSWIARRSPCDHPPSSKLAYHYPVRPFDRQHPIRGFFGDPRTVTNVPLARDSSLSAGSFGFHNGVDISAATGTPVYPVVSGVVVARLYADEVTVQTDDARRFQYYHLRPSVRIGQQVIAERTVLGHVLPGWLHVHLTEIDVFRAYNPLAPGRLEPFQQHTTRLSTALSSAALVGTTSIRRACTAASRSPQTRPKRHRSRCPETGSAYRSRRHWSPGTSNR
jgi:peptidase M23-like protein